MCGIAGFFNTNERMSNGKYLNVLKDMRAAVNRRGPDENGEYLSIASREANVVCGLSQARLSIRDVENGSQPMVKAIDGNDYALVYNGEIYNADELKLDLLQKCYHFRSTSDTEVILTGLIHYGWEFIKQLNGIYAFAFWNGKEKKLYLARDRAGVKPLFYTVRNGEFVFGSELKVLFQYPGIKPVIDRLGLCEIFGLGPARTHGVGVFKGVNEVKPGAYIVVGKHNNEISAAEQFYWKLESVPHTDSPQETVNYVRFLVSDAIKRQMVSDVPICSFLSGGVDSSLITAIANDASLRETGRPLNTFSFDFVDNKKYFKSSNFQAEEDRPYVDKMLKHLNTNHTYLECDSEDLADYLYKAVDAKDLPGMADVDASLLYFCERVKKYNKVALTGECADEIFGGYPWFHRQDMFEATTFPWSKDLSVRTSMLKQDALPETELIDYVQARYAESIADVPALQSPYSENATERRRRELSYLNLKWFMSTLLDRMDRVSMYSGLEARVPYADHRIMEYVFNVPWSIKCEGGVVKNLLRKAGADLLPPEILNRKKSPYPKTYHPRYEQIVRERFLDVLNDKSAPVHDFIDADKAREFMHSDFDYGKPWFGQLMAGPQMISYLLQINYWLKKYSISLA
ncbi:MAG: asparagine synthase (glutamine-hydrolyzing) [Clostridiales bacterium]|jgi:asparagine synthase (glutamine-hydrolysing)|nr:asparagine synthase (glutamine-hydrolyzing) [Clostridiales bacterium]